MRSSRRPKTKPELLALLFSGGQSPEVLGEAPIEGKANILIGSDPVHWRTGLPMFGQVRLKNVWPGIDVVVSPSGPRYDFIVSKGADPRRIRLRVVGARRLFEQENGSIAMEMPSGRMITQNPPVIYQEDGESRRRIDGRSVLKNDEIRFEVRKYDVGKALVIDPTIAFATYLGGATGASAFDRGNDALAGLAIDPFGNSYIAGATDSYLFPITSGAFTTADAVDSHVFVAKFSPSGKLIYSTVIGGTVGFQGGRAVDVANSVAIDPDGRAVVGGSTGSTNFPTANALQAYDGTDGLSYGFLLKMSANGDSLVFSTLLHGYVRDDTPPVVGGVTDDYVFGVATDGQGNVYATGITNTNNFPAGTECDPTPADCVEGPVFQRTSGEAEGEYSAWVGKFSPEGRRVYITYLGGVGYEEPMVIRADNRGRAYVAGNVFSSAFPLKNPAQATYRGFGDTFLTIFDSAGTDVVYSSLLGGNLQDWVEDILVDTDGRVYITGTTRSTSFNVVNAAQATDPDFFPGRPMLNKTDMFLARFDPARPGAASLLFSTYVGGNGFEGAYALAFDALQRPMLLSETDGTTFGPPGTGRRQSLTTHGPRGEILSTLSPAYSTGFFTKMATNSFGDTFLAGQSGIGFNVVNPAQALFGGGNFDTVLTRVCDCDRPVVPTLSGRQALSGNDWSFEYEVTATEGLVLHDVRLGSRYMAKKISVPYFDLRTSLGNFPHLALTASPGGGAGATRLVSLTIGSAEPPPGVGFRPLVLAAVYIVENVSPLGRSCLRIRQRYEFFKPISEAQTEDPALACEPSQVIPDLLGVGPDLFGPGLTCGRFKPAFEYDYCPAEAEPSFEVAGATRFHFRVDNDLQSAHLLTTDKNSVSEVITSSPLLSPITLPHGNPLAREIGEQPVLGGTAVPGTVDNFHQKGRLAPGGAVAQPGLSGPGCEECVHMHWRWGTFLNFPPETVPGAPLVPRGSKQTIDWAVTRFRSGEENPSGGFPSIVNGEAILNSDSVFWYGARSAAGSDRFLEHSLFFSPKKTAFASNGSWAVLYPDDAEPGLTTFGPIPASTTGILPFGYSAYQDPAVDIRAEGSTGTGAILVAFGVPEVNDPDLFMRLRIFHREGASLLDRTVLTGEFSPDFEGRTVYARVMSLSPFLLALGPVGGAVNRAPEAICRDLDRDAGATCMAEVTPDEIDGGSSDPDGDLLTKLLTPSGQFGLGDHGVTLSVSDPLGASAVCVARVVVADRSAPSLSCPGPIVLGTEPGRCSAAGNVEPPVAQDNCGATVEPTRSDGENLGARFLVGTTLIDWEAIDGAGLSATCQQTVVVADREAPIISGIAVDRAVLWPPNHKMTEVTVSYEVLDNCVRAPVCSLSISSNEPVNGGGDGNTSTDWEVLDAHHVRLRAERSGNGSGRVYTITAQCLDQAGLSSTTATIVTVPKNGK